LEIVRVLETQCIVLKNDFKKGDLGIYFPPDMLLPEEMADKLGIKHYLKTAVFPGEATKSNCRIGAVRLKGIASFGFLVPTPDYVEEGTDLTSLFSAVKYQPPKNFKCGTSIRQPEAFHIYTTIQHYYKYAKYLKEGTPVRITEKLHGTNARVGLIYDNDWEFVCGSHRQRKKDGLYCDILTDNIKDLLKTTQENTIIFGEILGRGIQFMDYGFSKPVFRVFDIACNGNYLNWETIEVLCNDFNIPTVPLLYCGPFKKALVDVYRSGPTTIAEPETIKSYFKDREGIVITPLKEEYINHFGRLILKAINPDYLARK
jgi:RNA ligase (TIGR02306 family)